MAPPPLPESIDNGKYKLVKKIGAGSFGVVYRATNTQTGEEVAIKLEQFLLPSPMLEHAAKILSMLQQPTQQQGFAEFLFFGFEAKGPYQCMVMELLGKSLEDMVQVCGGKLKSNTVVLIAEQVLHRIEYLHSKGIIHRDIKPENFMFGIKQKIHHIYLIDFGLSKSYWNEHEGHVKTRAKLSLIGTARYASINAHKGVEQSRRDDLEAAGHMFMYFLRGSLPWSGLEARTQEEKYRKIREKKEQTSLSDLCSGYPDAFRNYLQYARGLQYDECPDYDYIQSMFQEIRIKEGIIDDHGYEWFEVKQPPNELVPLVPRPTFLQPEMWPIRRFWQPTSCRTLLTRLRTCVFPKNFPEPQEACTANTSFVN